ncbi:MAG: discoidin domain-containing protein [Phycisphaerae bacterium]|nr:discoidin domain-containing protein [Phycisphaerae bacterium]
MKFFRIMAIALIMAFMGNTSLAQHRSISGVYPHLTMYNNEGECGTGAVVPFAGKLWVITYGPHKPFGSSDKLYEISETLTQVIRPESVGGTPANRMIHTESNQLNIGPYFIDADGQVRVISPEKMPGRHTGTARHLTDPANKVYIATMEEGLYSVDVNTLEFVEHIKDGNLSKPVQNGISSQLPGYHGKGLYSGQGELIYANNGQQGSSAAIDPTIDSGALASWSGEGDWKLIRRNQFTEVTGPGGIYGNQKPATDPIWAMGWDYRSVILMLLEDGQWHSYRLPKASHSYDGAHGWNTEWPRIRDIGEDKLLATMHGTFWKFPRTFSLHNSAGILPRSNYLKVIGDFAKWGDNLVLGCDDSAQKEFLNHRPFKSTKGAPVQSNSNLWFVDPGRLDKLGPAIGRGSIWLKDEVKANVPSDPYLFAGYDYRMMVINHKTQNPVTFTIEIDEDGNNNWKDFAEFKVKNNLIHIFPQSDKGCWLRVKTDIDAKDVSVHFNYRNKDNRTTANDPIFAPISNAGQENQTRAMLRSNQKVLSLYGEDGSFEVNEKLELTASGDSTSLFDGVGQPASDIYVDEASVVVNEDGKTYRLPKNEIYQDIASAETIESYLARSLAKSATITASSTFQNHDGSNTVDGMLGNESRWIAENAGPKWLEMDLGQIRTFQSIAVVTGWNMDSAYAVKNFDIQIKNNDSWQTLDGATIRDNNSATVVINLSESISAQHVRFVSNDKGYVRVYEIGLLNEKIAISSDTYPARICREVATERDLFNLHGTFYELPARNAQGFAKIRPIATHNLNINDYASHFGLMFISGLNGQVNDRVISSDNGKIAVWAGVIDDLWKLGKPRGQGGPWKNSVVKANKPSDPYLMTGYDNKSVTIEASQSAVITIEIDIDGTGLWVPYRTFTVKPGVAISHKFPEGFSAYWVRAISDVATTATVWFKYN